MARSLSSSETLARIADELAGVVAELSAGERAEDHPASDAVLSRLLSSTVVLYGTLATKPFGADALAELRVPPTEACTAAAALLRAQDLTPFEFAVWFSATGTREGSDERNEHAR